PLLCWATPSRQIHSFEREARHGAVSVPLESLGCRLACLLRAPLWCCAKLPSQKPSDDPVPKIRAAWGSDLYNPARPIFGDGRHFSHSEFGAAVRAGI